MKTILNITKQPINIGNHRLKADERIDLDETNINLSMKKQLERFKKFNFIRIYNNLKTSNDLEQQEDIKSKNKKVKK